MLLSPGLALGILFNFNPFIGAFVFLAATVIATWYPKVNDSLGIGNHRSTIRLGTNDRDSYHPRVDLLEALFGDVSKITLTDTIITVLVSVFVIFVTRRIYDKLVVLNNLLSQAG